MKFRELEIDCSAVAEKIEDSIRATIGKHLKRRGAIVAMSGGIDSTVAAALCRNALGADRVLGLFLPEQDSSADTIQFSQMAADWLGIDATTEDITPVLQAAGCYSRRDEAVRTVIPEYELGWKLKLVLPSLLETDALRVFYAVATGPNGETVRRRLSHQAYLGIVAATNFKQRTRKMFEYYHADRLNYAVIGTPNRLEYDQGFFVKLGDGSADLKPIAHLYKTQVYELAEYLGVPEDIRSRPPTTDTYSMAQGQDEFYFSLPYDRMDICLYGKNNGLPKEYVADAAELTMSQLERIYDDIDQKRRTTRYQHLSPVLAQPVAEIDSATNGHH